MTPATRTVHFSMTEVPHFNRLVEFLAAVRDYADTIDDWQLQAMVDTCRSDLASMLRKD